MPNKQLTKTGGKDYGDPGLSKVNGTVSGINTASAWPSHDALFDEFGMGGTGSPDDQSSKPFDGGSTSPRTSQGKT